MNFHEAFIDELLKVAVNLAAGKSHPPIELENFRARQAIRAGGQDLSRRIAEGTPSYVTDAQMYRLKNERAGLRNAPPKSPTRRESVWDIMDVPDDKG